MALEAVGATLTAGGHRTSKNDIDEDGWYDSPILRASHPSAGVLGTARPERWATAD